jgi:hypothetical protein
VASEVGRMAAELHGTRDALREMHGDMILDEEADKEWTNYTRKCWMGLWGQIHQLEIQLAERRGIHPKECMISPHGYLLGALEPNSYGGLQQGYRSHDYFLGAAHFSANFHDDAFSRVLLNTGGAVHIATDLECPPGTIILGPSPRRGDAYFFAECWPEQTFKSLENSRWEIIAHTTDFALYTFHPDSPPVSFHWYPKRYTLYEPSPTRVRQLADALREKLPELLPEEILGGSWIIDQDVSAHRNYLVNPNNASFNMKWLDIKNHHQTYSGFWPELVIHTSLWLIRANEMSALQSVFNVHYELADLRSQWRTLGLVGLIYWACRRVAAWWKDFSFRPKQRPPPITPRTNPPPFRDEPEPPPSDDDSDREMDPAGPDEEIAEVSMRYVPPDGPGGGLRGGMEEDEDFSHFRVYSSGEDDDLVEEQPAEACLFERAYYAFAEKVSSGLARTVVFVAVSGSRVLKRKEVHAPRLYTRVMLKTMDMFLWPLKMVGQACSWKNGLLKRVRGYSAEFRMRANDLVEEARHSEEFVAASKFGNTTWQRFFNWFRSFWTHRFDFSTDEEAAGSHDWTSDEDEDDRPSPPPYVYVPEDGKGGGLSGGRPFEKPFSFVTSLRALGRRILYAPIKLIIAYAGATQSIWVEFKWWIGKGWRVIVNWFTSGMGTSEEYVTPQVFSGEAPCHTLQIQLPIDAPIEVSNDAFLDDDYGFVTPLVSLMKQDQLRFPITLREDDSVTVMPGAVFRRFRMPESQHKFFFVPNAFGLPYAAAARTAAIVPKPERGFSLRAKEVLRDMVGGLIDDDASVANDEEALLIIANMPSTQARRRLNEWIDIQRGDVVDPHPRQNIFSKTDETLPNKIGSYCHYLTYGEYGNLESLNQAARVLNNVGGVAFWTSQRLCKAIKMALPGVDINVVTQECPLRTPSRPDYTRIEWVHAGTTRCLEWTEVVYDSFLLRITNMSDADQYDKAFWMSQAQQILKDNEGWLIVGGDDNLTCVRYEGVIYYFIGDVSKCDQSHSERTLELFRYGMYGLSPHVLKNLLAEYHSDCQNTDFVVHSKAEAFLKTGVVFTTGANCIFLIGQIVDLFALIQDSLHLLSSQLGRARLGANAKKFFLSLGVTMKFTVTDTYGDFHKGFWLPSDGSGNPQLTWVWFPAPFNCIVKSNKVRLSYRANEDFVKRVLRGNFDCQVRCPHLSITRRVLTGLSKLNIGDRRVIRQHNEYGVYINQSFEPFTEAPGVDPDAEKQFLLDRYPDHESVIESLVDALSTPSLIVDLNDCQAQALWDGFARDNGL